MKRKIGLNQSPKFKDKPSSTLTVCKLRPCTISFDKIVTLLERRFLFALVVVEFT